MRRWWEAGGEQLPNDPSKRAADAFAVKQGEANEASNDAEVIWVSWPREWETTRNIDG